MKSDESVFKYRGGSEEIFQRDLQALMGNYFFAPTYNNLNDPCEGMILSDKMENQSSLLFKIIGGAKQDLTDFIEVKNEFLQAKDKIGIYSLSGSYLNELLWAHYAGGHYGFCIGFNIQKLVNNNLYQKLRSSIVKYSDRLPNLGLLDVRDEDKIISKLIGQKSKLWSYEKETRIISDIIGKNYYEHESIDSIFFWIKNVRVT